MLFTSPFIHSGGGPGGWGSAIVEVPYQLYRHYGDTQVLEDNFEGMLKYVRFLEGHMEHGFITYDKEGYWCLGDWCGPFVLWHDRELKSGNAKMQMLLPAPFVNNYFMIRSMETICKIAKILGKSNRIKSYPSKIKKYKSVLNAAYFNAFDHNFVMNAHGANAYAVDLGIGTEKTYESMKTHYQKLGFYDTGIFATDILTRVLFEKGDGDLAVDIMTGKGECGFANWMENGATTLHEYWDSNRSRSHNHHMFGSPVAYLFEYLLGIKQKELTGGYKSVVIAPQAVSRFGRMSGSITTPNGVLLVSYKKTDEVIEFNITIPEKTKAVFLFGGKESGLKTGENHFCESI